MSRASARLPYNKTAAPIATPSATVFKFSIIDVIGTLLLGHHRGAWLPVQLTAL